MYIAGILRLAATAALLAGLSVTSAPARAQAQSEVGRLVYEKANCVGCHKWHGAGGGGYGGAALSLRETSLARADLLEVIRCGRPATRMPHHDRNAYEGTECYGGMRKADLGPDFPPKAAIFLRDEEIEAVADYVIAEQQGKGAPSFDDCIAFWGEGSRQCDALR
jgi:Cytochrome C oxidase, cbb3-type, subunit III